MDWNPLLVLHHLLLHIFLISAAYLRPSSATNHIVGDSIWTIPPAANFYTTWSNNQTFTAGDKLVFRFETGFYNVAQVSRREYEDCSAENPFRSFLAGPATVPVAAEGMYYFITSFGNYCRLGQRLAVAVNPPLRPSNSN